MWYTSRKYTRLSPVTNLHQRFAKLPKMTTPRMFADDTNLTAVVKTLGEAEERARVDLRNVHKLLSLNKLSSNIVKTEYSLIASRHKINTIEIQPTVKINNSQLVKE